MKYKDPVLISSLFVLVSLGAVLYHFGPQFFKSNNKTFFPQTFDKFCINNFCVDKQENDWFVESEDYKIPADNETVKIYTDKFKQIKLDDLISENQNKFKDLGIGTDPKVSIEINDKKIEIGSIAADTDGTYVKKDGEAKVYKVDSILAKENFSSPEFWYLKNLTDLPALQIKKVTVKWQDHNKEFVPKDGIWENNEMIKKITDLYQTKFLSSLKPDLGKSYEYKVDVEDRDQVAIFVGKDTINDKQTVYWASTDKKYFFEISKTDFETLTAPLN